MQEKLCVLSRKFELFLGQVSYFFWFLFTNHYLDIIFEAMVFLVYVSDDTLIAILVLEIMSIVYPKQDQIFTFYPTL